VFVISKNDSENKKDKLILFLLFVSFFFLALWRYSISCPENKVSNIVHYQGREFKIIGQVYNDPVFKDKIQRVSIKVLFIENDEGERIKISGKVLAIVDKYPLYNYGDIVEVYGQWLLGEKKDNFDYALYLRRYNISLVSYYPRLVINIDIIKRKNFFKNFVYKFKRQVSDVFDGNLSVSSSAMAKAMLLGDKSGLSYEDRQNFSKTGLSHIVAISGLHISLLSSILLNFLLAVGLSRKKSFYFILGFLISYLILIGVPASAFRAVLMGTLSLLSVYLGRKSDISSLLFFSALVLLLINPFLLLADIGFQLSFLAVLGIVYIQPRVKEFFLKKRFLRKSRKRIKSMIEVISVTTSAQIATAPILIFKFGQFSFIAPISNLFVLWALPFAIIFLIVALIFSFFLPFLSPLLFLPAEIVFSYIYFISNIFLLIPGAFVNF
jgi:competence protein ComEC